LTAISAAKADALAASTKALTAMLEIRRFGIGAPTLGRTVFGCMVTAIEGGLQFSARQKAGYSADFRRVSLRGDAAKREWYSHSTDVRYGSKADIARHWAHVRFTPESGHQSDINIREMTQEEAKTASLRYLLA
jgi:hypothetical protein